MSEKCAKECATPIEDLTIADMQKAIEERFAPVTHCEVDDLGTCGTSYKVIIVSVSLTNELNLNYFFGFDERQ